MNQDYTTGDNSVPTTEQLVSEFSDRLVPIHQAVNLLAQKISHRGISLESAQETLLLQKLQGCLRGLELRLSEIGASNRHLIPQFETFSINTLIQEVLDRLQHELDGKCLLIKTDIPLEDFVVADKQLMHMAMFRLIKNAIQNCQMSGEILVTVVIDRFFWDVEVADSGPGLENAFQRQWMDEAQRIDLQNQFQQCVTRVTQIANCHDGTVSIANCPQGGVAVSLSIPRTDPHNSSKSQAA